MYSQQSERLKQLTSYGIVALLCVPFFLWVKLPSNWTTISVALYLGLITGFLGIILLLWEFLLGTRAITAIWYKDLAWTLKIHKNIGIYGTILIFMHPILITYAYGERWLYAILPDFSSRFETAVSWGRIALMIMLVIWATSAILRSKIAYRPWKYIHYVSHAALPLSFIHSPQTGRSLHDSHILLMYWYGLTVFYLVMVILRLRHIFGFGKRSFTVVSQRLIADNIYELHLRPREQEPSLRLGQYIYMQPNLLHEQHPFSVLDFNNQSGEMLVAYKQFGWFTRALSRINKGSSVYVDGPYGVFTHDLNLDPNLPTVFIAGGIGMTPFVKHIMQTTQDQDRYVFYCNRNKTSGIYVDQMRQLLGPRFIQILSDITQVSEQDEQGYFRAEILEKYVTSPVKYHYYLCGPKLMMEHAMEVLLAAGVSKDHIQTEEFNF